MGVFSACARTATSWPARCRLYLPKDWVEDGTLSPRTHSGRGPPTGSKCEIPLELVDSARITASDLATWPLTGARQGSRLPAAWRRFTVLFGRCPQASADLAGNPAPYRPETLRGRPASIRRTDRPALTVAECGPHQPVSAWKHPSPKLRQGQKGTLNRSICTIGYRAWDPRKKPHAHWHLLVRRECGADTPSHFAFSNADHEHLGPRLARMHGCPSIEHAFRAGQERVGHGEALSGASLGCLASPHGAGHGCHAVSAQASASATTEATYALSG